MKKSFVAFLIAIVAISACKDEAKPAKADAPTPNIGDAPKHDKVEPKGDDHDHEHEHDEDVHLGAHMYEISKRFAAVWYAGQAGNKEMVDYQIHEIEEVIEEIKPHKPVEAGVDVVARLKQDIEPNLEKIEQAVEKGDTKAFEAAYQATMNNCTRCHADTKHPYIQVKIPDYNPYPNLKF